MGANYWMGLGPITKDEEKRAFKYLSDNKRPKTTANIRTYVAKLRKRRHLNRYLRGKLSAATEASRPWEIVYGDTRAGGLITFMHTSGPANDTHLYMHLIITLAAHEIFQITTVYFDEYPVAWKTDLTTRPTGLVLADGLFDNLVRMQINYGSTSQTALSVPVGDNTDAVNPVSSKWTSDHRQRGHAHVYFRLRYDDRVFKNGLPDISFIIRGKTMMVDPRPTPAIITPANPNAALVLYDYMLDAGYGLGLQLSDFNKGRLDAAINACEESVSLAGGGSEARYTVNGVYTADESPGAVIEEILSCMAGRLTYSEGKWSLYAGAAQTPVINITEDMIVSDVSIVTKTPRQDSFNSVRGNHNSAKAAYEEADFPVVSNSTYITNDGGIPVYEDLTFDKVPSPATCQRLAKIELETVRQGIQIEFTGNMACYQAEPGEWVNVTLSRFGWTNKTFEVVKSALQIEDDENGVPAFSVQMTLKETAAGIYDWNSGMETTVDLAPDTSLPNAFVVVAPYALTLASGTDHLYIRSDGTVFSRLYLSWTAAPDTFVVNGGYYEIQYKKSAVVDWQDGGSVPGSSTNYYILDVDDGWAYDVRIRSVNSLGARSDWHMAVAHVVVGKTAPPSDVSSLSVIVEGFGIKLVWSPVLDLDVREYEIRYGTTSDSWDAIASTAIRVRATNFYFRNFAAGVTRFQVKAIDTSGNYSANSALATFTISAPGAVLNYTLVQIDNNILVDWDAPTTTIFPVEHYRVYKGATFSGATLIGKVGGTFYTYIEQIGGTYTYWVTAVDTAGNEGAPVGSSLLVYNPPDYILIDSRTLNPANATLVRAYNEGNGSFLSPANITETWTQHFTNNSQTTIQGFISAGYSYFLQPTPASAGTAEWTYVLDTVIPQNIINLDYVHTQIAGTTTVTPLISWKQNIGDAWTDGTPGAKRVFATNFKYVKILLTCLGSSNLALSRISSITSRINTKKQTDSGTGAAIAMAPEGTIVNFNLSFLNVTSIVVTPRGTTAGYAIVDFNGAVPNPTSFRVYLYDINGSRMSGNFSWTAEGVVNVAS